MNRRAALAFAAISLIWGVSYLFIRIAVRGGMTPLTLAWGRVTLAAVVLLVLAWRAGTLPTLRGRWRWLLAYAVAEITIPFPMIAFGEQRVSSSLAAITIAAVPLIGALLALRFDHSERPTPVRAVGLLIGFAGVVALVGIDVAGSARELVGIAGVLLAALGYAIGPMLVKHRLAALDPRATMGASLGIVAVLLAPAAALDLPARLPTAGAFASVVILGLLCTALAFVIFAVLIREAGTSRAMVITYVNPVVAVALGVALLGEQPGAGAVAGLLLILAGSWLSTGGRLPPLRLPASPHRASPGGTRAGRVVCTCTRAGAVSGRLATTAPCVQRTRGAPPPPLHRAILGRHRGPATEPGGPTFTSTAPGARACAAAPGELGLGRAYVAGLIEVDDLDGALRVVDTYEPPALPLAGSWIALGLVRACGPWHPLGFLDRASAPRRAPHARARPACRASSLRRGQRVLRPVPRPSITYSCACFAAGVNTLEEAQRHEARARVHQAGNPCRGAGAGRRLRLGKLRHPRRRHHGVQVLGITLAERQAELARERVREAGVADRVEIRVADYRELVGRAVRCDLEHRYGRARR